LLALWSSPYGVVQSITGFSFIVEMAMHLKLNNVSVDFPVLEQSDRSLRSVMARRVGATLGGSAKRPLIYALRHISLELTTGDRLAVIGHNGAGKSTFLKVCAGIYEPTRGSVSRSGSVMSMTDFLMGMDPALSGYQNIQRRAAFMGLNAHETKSIISKVSAFSELGDFLGLPTRTYSTGMFIRLAFAISTSVESDILILDEMISAGDLSFMEKASTRMENLIHDLLLLAELGETTEPIREELDLSELVKSHSRDFQTLHPQRLVDIEIEGELSCLGSTDHLRRLIQNILNNISRHTPHDAPVHIELARSGKKVRILIIFVMLTLVTQKIVAQQNRP
jgi:ABC-type polysaccharide/polyol phosphate transport system ATPase subunit